ncbi:MAG: ShlB/FhaC/HecB family hemolysin secretion/activation protein [Alphaproteobacteria bacterium]
MAQQAVNSASPGQIDKRFAVEPTRPMPTGPDMAPTGPAPGVPDTALGFTVKSLQIQGASILTDADREMLADLLVGRELTPARLNEALAALTRLYREKGYSLSRGALQDTDPVAGSVTLRAIEGYIDNIVIEGQVEGSAALIESYLRAITGRAPIGNRELERAVLLVSDLAGATVRPLVEPSETGEGAFNLVLLMEHRDSSGFVQFDNRGTRFNGRFQLWGGVTLNSPLGFYESVDVRYVTVTQTEELRFASLFYRQPLGGDGLVASFAASHGDSEPGFTLENLGVENVSLRFELGLSYPIIRSRSENLYFNGRFTYRDTDSERFEELRLFKDHHRVLGLGLYYGTRDPWDADLSASFEISQGLDAFGASGRDGLNLSRFRGRSDFTKATVFLSRYQRFWERVGLYWAARGQWAAHRLLESELAGFGGSRFGRAYDPSEILGDDGVGTEVELQLDAPAWEPYLTGVTFYGFYDVGATWLKGGLGRQSMASAGAGLRLGLGAHLYATVEGAQPLTRPVFAEGSAGDDPRVFFTLRAYY